MVAAEHVLGGRAFHGGSRVNEARVNLHLFGVVEGEDDLILMGMVRDVTQRFVERYLSSLLGVIEVANTAPGGGKAAGRPTHLADRRRRRSCAIRAAAFAAKARLLVQPKFWQPRCVGRR